MIIDIKFTIKFTATLSCAPYRKFYFILFHFVLYTCISYKLLALQGTAGYISQSNKQEGQITYQSHSNSKLAETAENGC